MRYGSGLFLSFALGMRALAAAAVLAPVLGHVERETQNCFTLASQGSLLVDLEIQPHELKTDGPYRTRMIITN